MRRLGRLISIAVIFWRFRLDTFFQPNTIRPGPWQWLVTAPWRLLRIPSEPRGERLRRSLESLGPIFIKFGQLLSTRRDLMPADIADELSKLQDQVPPFPHDQAVALIEAALKGPVSETFSKFDSQPLASASVAQVYGATLHDGSNVVVKVIRPGIDKVIRDDLALLYLLARLIHRYHPDGRRLHAGEVVKDYETVVFDELDLMREAGNTAQLRRNFADSDLLYVPAVHWDYTRRNVFVMERIHGIPVSDVAALKAAGTDLKELAERGLKIFFTQVFRDSFFHADMHPGNIFVSVEDPSKPRYIGIDCAIMGSLSDFDQYYLARNLLAIFNRQYRQVAELHVECGWVPTGTRVHEFEAAIRTVCEPIFERPLGEISFGQLLLHLFQTARRFDMEVQTSLVLLQKTLLHIEGLGRQLYPELDIWANAKPFLEDWLAQRYSPGGLAEKLGRMAPSLLESLPQGPQTLLNLLQDLKGSHAPKMAIEGRENRLQRLEQEMRHIRERQHRYWLMAGVAIIALLLFDAPSSGINAQLSWSTAALLLIGFLAGRFVRR